MNLTKSVRDWIDDTLSVGILDYPSKCVICGFDGYESQVRKHVRLAHPGIIEEAKRIMARHRRSEISLTEARHQIVEFAAAQEEYESTNRT